MSMSSCRWTLWAPRMRSACTTWWATCWSGLVRSGVPAWASASAGADDDEEQPAVGSDSSSASHPPTSEAAAANGGETRAVPANERARVRGRVREARRLVRVPR